MGKKQRRKQQPQRTAPQGVSPAAAASVVQAAVTPQVRTSPVTAATGAKSRSGMAWSEFADRYSYVNRELKQIGILAGSFLVVLLILTVVLG